MGSYEIFNDKQEFRSNCRILATKEVGGWTTEVCAGPFFIPARQGRSLQPIQPKRLAVRRICEVATKIAWVVDGAKDNVATILSRDITRGKTIPITVGEKEILVTANAGIPYGHKIAIQPIKKGETVFKYGLSIGKATTYIEVGDHVHIHNTESNRGRGDLAVKETGTQLFQSGLIYRDRGGCC
jgi:altronate dehydratase small subunit